METLTTILGLPMILVGIFGRSNLVPKLGIAFSQFQLSCHFSFIKVWKVRIGYNLQSWNFLINLEIHLLISKFGIFIGCLLGSLGLPISIVSKWKFAMANAYGWNDANMEQNWKKILRIFCYQVRAVTGSSSHVSVHSAIKSASALPLMTLVVSNSNSKGCSSMPQPATRSVAASNPVC